MKTKEEILKKHLDFSNAKTMTELLLKESILKAMDENAQQERDKFKPLYIAAGNLLYLHLYELEGIGRMPTQKQWLKAVNELEKELGLNDKK